MDAEARPSIRMQRPSGSGFGAIDDEQYSAERRENTKGGKAAGAARGRQNRSSGDSRYPGDGLVDVSDRVDVEVL